MFFKLPERSQESKLSYTSASHNGDATNITSEVQYHSRKTNIIDLQRRNKAQHRKCACVYTYREEARLKIEIREETTDASVCLQVNI